MTFNIPKLRRKESFFLIITVSPQLPPYEVFKENISIKGKYHGHNVYTEYENIKEISKKNEITDALKSKRWDGFVGHYKEDYKREN